MAYAREGGKDGDGIAPRGEKTKWPVRNRDGARQKGETAFLETEWPSES